MENSIILSHIDNLLYDAHRYADNINTKAPDRYREHTYALQNAIERAKTALHNLKYCIAQQNNIYPSTNNT